MDGELGKLDKSRNLCRMARHCEARPMVRSEDCIHAVATATPGVNLAFGSFHDIMIAIGQPPHCTANPFVKKGLVLK